MLNSEKVSIMNILVGYTGFVGSNLHSQYNFDRVYNSKNISDAFGSNPDLCIYAGVRAEKFLANNDPKADMAIIDNAVENIKRIKPKRLVLISTIDVYKAPYNCDENTSVDEKGLHAYGLNRCHLEKQCADNIASCHIIRLPGLFGKNIKKNFIYDLIHILPSVLGEAKFNELSEKEAAIKSSYTKQGNGFYKLTMVTDSGSVELLDAFTRLKFSALSFTDSRAVFQFYNLSYLWEHIDFSISNEIRLLHLAVEPVSASELYTAIRGGVFYNDTTANPPYYDSKSVYASRLGGRGSYIFSKQQIIGEIKEFVADYNLLPWRE